MIHGSVGGDSNPISLLYWLMVKEYTGVVTDPGNGTLTYTIPVLTQGYCMTRNIHAR